MTHDHSAPTGSGHAHAHPVPAGGRLLAAVAVNLILTAAQVIGGILAGSLSLVADALHNFSDAASLGIALVARTIAGRGADASMTYGYARAEPVAALINLTTLILIGLYLLYEAVSRFLSPQPVEGWIVVWVAGIALVIDLITAYLVYAPAKHSLNLRAALLHNISDALASVAVIVSGTLIILYQTYWTDLAATVLIAGYVLWQGFSEIGRVIRLLMDATPPGVDIGEVANAVAAVPGVRDVHHLHVRELDEQRRGLEAHVVVDSASGAEMDALKERIRTVVKERFGVVHTTFELEFSPCTVSGELAPHACYGQSGAGHSRTTAQRD